jgi:outer membrane protein
MKRHLLALFTLSTGFLTLPALADDSTNLVTARASQRSTNQTEQVIGVGAGYGTRYFGAESGWQAGLLGEANFSNGVFLSTHDGIGLRFLENTNGFSAAASIGASGMRKESYGDNDGHNRLRGMGDVNLRAQANLFVNYDVGAFHVNAGLHQTLGDRHDTSVDVVGRYDIYASKTDLVDVSAGFGIANKNMMKTYFGVNAAQSASSGNAEYAPKAGVLGGGIGVNWRHAINPNWVTTVSASATRLGSEAADSPLNDRRTTAGIGATIGYRF